MRKYPVPRFVILEHDWPERHWDLLLEEGSVLKAWRLAEQPSPGSRCRAEPNFDHRLLYLDYEGPLSGDRGSVQRWDAGEYFAHPAGIVLTGTKLNGLAEWHPESGYWVFTVEC